MFKWANWFGRDNTEKEILSPDKRTRCLFVLKNGEMFYQVERDGKILVDLSKLGFLVCGEKSFGDNLKLIRSQTKHCDEIVELLWGEDQFLKNHYYETIFYLSETKDPKRIITLRFRVFNDAVTFRY